MGRKRCPLDIIGDWLLGLVALYMLAQVIRFILA